MGSFGDGNKNKNLVYFTMWGIEPIFYNNSKWSKTFKNCDSLYFTPVTYTIFYSYYTSFKNNWSQKLSPNSGLELESGGH